ncbi:HEAT repeat domain-containing protein [Nostoc sp.]|uniref:HEAT repeat domain-containing protein n=1 Tax=Nostoc sp. TaxID=1180 RepID=UPI002FF505C9
MLITPRHTNKRSLFFLFWFTLLLTLFLSLPWVNAEEKPKPEVWQINGIVAALKDPIPEVRATATQNLQEYQLDNPKSQIKNYDELVKQFAKQLQDKDSSVSRKAAIKALGQMQAKEKIPLVAKLLKDSGTGVRGAAVKALGQMQAKEVVPQVVKLLTNPDSGVRKAAAEALGQMQAKEQIPILVHLLTNPDGGVRGAAIEALGQMQAKEQAPQVAKLLKDSDGGVRGAAIEALGQMQAKEVVPQVALLLTNPNVDARYAAIKALGQMQAKEQIPILVQLLKNPEGVIRDAAVKALGQMQAKEQAPQLILLLKEDPDSGVRKAAAEALIKLGQQDLPVVVQVLDSVHSYPSEVGQIRFVAHFLGGGKPQVETLMQWVGKPKMRPEKPTHDQGVEVMEVFKETWKHFDSLPELRRELAEQISEVAAKKKIIWKAQDINLLQTHYSNLKKINSTHADTLQSVINNVEYWQWFFKANNTILIHAAFWLALIFAYPKFPQVQAIFFWNPWVRRILGVGYVGFLLTWFPPFRRKLFEPFKPSLLADAGLDNFYEQSYFPESKVKVPVSGDILPITPALPSIQGQIILEGDSGLGKSMFLRHLLKNSQRIVVYLPAQKCNKGVIEAIQDKLHGQAQDAGFLKNLIYSGAIDICIDGLNEVTAETRAKICQFVESYFRGNIIMTTQPLEWTPPSTAKIYYLHPLEQQQIQQFLISRQPRLPKDAKVQGDDYAKACTNYLTEVLNNQQVKEELNAAQRTLSNPMDLTVVALMLSQGKYPNLFRLQEQQYNLMAAEYLQEWKQEFPLKKFSAAVYQMRLEDKQALPADEFHQVVMSLSDEKYKMVVSRQWEGEKGEAKKEWYFRHDKIMDFFLVQNFLGETDAAEGILVDRIPRT